MEKSDISKAKRAILAHDRNGYSGALHRITRGNFKEELVVLRDRLREVGEDFAADDFFDHGRLKAPLRNRGDCVGDMLDILHDAGVTVDVATFTKKDGNSNTLFNEMLPDGLFQTSGIQGMLASHYWHDHPEDLKAVKQAFRRMQKRGFPDSSFSRRLWEIGEYDGDETLAELRAELQAFDSDLTKADFFLPKRGGAPELMFGYRDRKTAAGIGLILDLMHEQGEHISVEEWTKGYGEYGKSILRQVVGSGSVTKMFASPYWDNYPEDRAALKERIPMLAEPVRKEFVAQFNRQGGLLGSLPNGSHEGGAAFVTALANRRRDLQAFGSDFEKNDFFGDGFEAPPLLLKSAIQHIGAAMNIMGELGETVKVSALTRNWGVGGAKLSLVSEAIKYGQVGSLVSSRYWSDHPDDLVQLWKELPRKVRNSTPTPVPLEYAQYPTLEHLRQPAGMVRRFTHKPADAAHVMALPLYKLVRNGHSDYLLKRLELAGEKLTLDDCLLGRSAGLPTLVEMMIEQGQLAKLMEPDRWGYGEDGVGRLLIGLSVSPEMLAAQTGLKREDLLIEFEAQPLGKRMQAELRESLGKLNNLRLKPEELGLEAEPALPSPKAEREEPEPDWRLTPQEPVKMEDVGSIIARISAGESLTDLMPPPKPINMTQAEILVDAKDRELDAKDEELKASRAEIAALRAELAVKPATVIERREASIGERVSDLAALINAVGKP